MILAEITVNSTVYYCSTEGYQGLEFYYPFIVSMPRLDIGPVGKGGLIGVQLGDIVLTKDPHNENHPFGGGRFNDLITNSNQYLCKILWSENREVLHDAAISLLALDANTLTFTLADKAYEQTLKRYSITQKWNYVEEVKNTNPLTCEVPNHEFVVGQRVVFSNMTGAGIELNYSKTSDNYYVIGSVNGDDVGLLDKEDNGVDPVDITTGVCTFDNGTDSYSGDRIPKNRIGIPAYVPFTHGTVFHKTPVVRRWETEVANPNMLTGNSNFPLEVYEDGVLIGTTDPTSSEYFDRLPDADVIYLNNAMAEGDLSISGRSANGGTLKELFQYFATKLGLGFDDSKA